MTVDVADMMHDMLYKVCCQCGCKIWRYGTYDWRCANKHRCSMQGCFEHKPHHKTCRLGAPDA